MFENDYRTVEARNKTLLGFGFDFGNENQITCTRSNQQAFGNELLAYENDATRRASDYSPGRVSQVMTTRQGELQSE
ncbi:hypothetical protein QL285_057234 [Trifolium repens]|nr:hypothetical protein QL285_057234 [Trifolium repens]